MLDSASPLTAFQIEVARLFVRPVGQRRFLLAGGGALLAHGLTARPTQDLDFFTRPDGGDVRRARDELIAAAGARGWSVDSVQDSETFCRLLVHGSEDLVVDLALDSAPGRPASATHRADVRTRRTRRPRERATGAGVIRGVGGPAGPRRC